MKIVCDASFFFGEYPLDGDLFTTPLVIAELCDLRSKCRLDALKAGGLTVIEPPPESFGNVRKAAESTGDIGVLSETDVSILALASTIRGEVATDDFAVQNVAAALGIRVRPILQRRAKRRIWKMVCTGCGRDVEEGADCPVCGAPLKRRHK
ncbi:nucleotide-binding protein [Methanocalculus taiwanensis]|uniref:Nucleotide-binding protein n=1 Tax=Methanocalculus taiwanensis TaxID=106207 RepID=A0ABD4TM90_9EURY|nr:nucleotide-binding protein [Methanocalculus taiwanensis]MCQ1538732.1 nucleotide-binding protein [Methanocalculus taiwanensis]